ncbi:MAG: T9SS type A sorting domain-containing protein, partial [Bacteroidetes bacterium]|nr:T9SS type A sorting domain-containing protein [Bacteroidota bacterium]
SNTDGDTDPGIAWDQWSDSTWHAMFLSSSWGLNLAQAIFPIVDYGNLPLMADFMASPTHIQPGGSVTFTDLSTGNPTSREWTFEGGDPATSNEPSLVVVYNEEGTYDVTLTVEKDTIQDTKSVADYITVASTSIEVDTLNYPLEGTYAVYITEGNGFVSGNNEFGDLAKANYYNVNENLFITGILYEFAYGTGGGSIIELSIWNNSGTNNSPGSKIAFKTLPLDDILDDVEAQDFTYVEFNPPVLVNGPFYAGLMLPTTTGDTLVVWSNMHNDTDPGIAWELWNTNEWYPFSTSWLQDVALAIYPIVQNTLDVNENAISGGLYIYPNPSDGQYTIELAKHSHQALQLEVFNTSGNCIADQSYEKGEVSISFDISGFPAGIYMVRLTDSQHTYLQKIIKK